MSKRYIVIDSDGDALIGYVENRYPVMGCSTEAIIFNDCSEANDAMEEITSPLRLSIIQLEEEDERVVYSRNVIARYNANYV